MKSLNTYSKSKNTHFTSLTSRIENAVNHDVLGLIKEHGSNIDSIMHKLEIHSYRVKNSNYILESDQDVLLDIDEQYAVRDIFVNICESYEASLYRNFCLENNIDIDVDLVNEGLKDTFKNINNLIKDKSQVLKDKFNALTDKVKGIKEFIAEVLKNGIDSVKKLLDKFEELMIKIGESLKSLLDKLTNKQSDSYHEFYIDGCRTAFEEEMKTKEIQKQYESLQYKLVNNIAINESEIFEFLGFGKKKNANAQNDASEGNEYEDSIDAKAGKKSLKDNIIVKILLQFAIHWFLTKGIAVIITIAVPGVGPAIATIYLPIANLLWASISGFKTIKQIIQQVFITKEFKNLPTKKKITTVVLWLFSLGLTAYSAMGIVGELNGIYKHFLNGGALENLMPSETIRELANKINELYKSMGGSGFKNVEAMNAKVMEFGGAGLKGAVEKTETTTTTTKAEIGENGDKLLKDFSDAKKTFDNSMDAVNWLKERGLSEDQIKSLLDGDKVYVYCDGVFNKANKWSRELMEIIGVSDSKTAVNAGLNAMNPNAGASTVIEMTKEQFLKAQAAGCLGANGHHAVIGAVKTSVETVSKSILGFVGRNLGFSGLMPIVQKYMKGGFKVRLGSNRTGNHLYNIPDESYVKEVSYNKFITDFSKLNPKAIAEMKKYVDANIQLAEEYKKEIEKKENLKRADKKLIEKLTKFMEQFKEGKSEIKMLVFCTDDEFADMKSSESEENTTNESLDFDSILTEGLFDFFKSSKKKDDKKSEETESPKNNDDTSSDEGEQQKPEENDDKKPEEKKDDKKSKGQYPVFFFNPITLCGGDLTRRTKTKGPRAHIYLAKGLLSRLEFITVNGGMSGKDIVEMFGKFISDSLKASYEMTADVPCIKKDGEKTWIANPESKNKGKERMDFGGFTNEQIATFLNNPDKVTDFLGGQHATDTISGGKHKYIEQDDTEEKKAHNEEVKKQFKDLLSNNDELKTFIKEKCDTVFKTLYDDEGKLREEAFEKLVPSLMRIENTYLNGENKNGIFKKIKNFFKDNTEIDVDPSEIMKVSKKVASMRKKLKLQRTAEGFEDDFVDIIVEANMEILEAEFVQWWEEDDTKRHIRLVK
jgi:hypothetical protein